jgi:hypothetical protein
MSRDKDVLHCQDQNSLLIPCLGFSDEEKDADKSQCEKRLN